MEVANYQIRRLIKKRLFRKYRGGLIKNKTKAEGAFEGILRKLRIDYIFQAGFLTAKSFYIVDFYLKGPYRLVVEIDGNDHLQKKKRISDQKKRAHLRHCGFKVLKFRNHVVLDEGLRVQRQLRNCLFRLNPAR